jgi:hypothetical protein
VDLTQSLEGSEDERIRFAWRRGEPPGEYTFFVQAVVPGSFGDGAADPGDVLFVGSASFTFGIR